MVRRQREAQVLEASPATSNTCFEWLGSWSDHVKSFIFSQSNTLRHRPFDKLKTYHVRLSFVGS